MLISHFSTQTSNTAFIYTGQLQLHAMQNNRHFQSLSLIVVPQSNHKTTTRYDASLIKLGFIDFLTIRPNHQIKSPHQIFPVAIYGISLSTSRGGATIEGQHLIAKIR